MEITTVTDFDTDHVDHDTYVVETIHDNPVEKTTWSHCNDCNTGFKAVSVSMEGDW